MILLLPESVWNIIVGVSNQKKTKLFLFLFKTTPTTHRFSASPDPSPRLPGQLRHAPAHSGGPGAADEAWANENGKSGGFGRFILGLLFEIFVQWFCSFWVILGLCLGVFIWGVTFWGRFFCMFVLFFGRFILRDDFVGQIFDDFWHKILFLVFFGATFSYCCPFFILVYFGIFLGFCTGLMVSLFVFIIWPS